METAEGEEDCVCVAVIQHANVSEAVRGADANTEIKVKPKIRLFDWSTFANTPDQAQATGMYWHGPIQPAKLPSPCPTPVVVVETQSSQEKFGCDKCVRFFDSKHGLNIHLRMVHRKPYVCKICKKKYVLKFGLDSHMTTIHGEKKVDTPRKRKVYKRKCSRKDDLNLNYRKARHSEVKPKPYQCNVCSKRFQLNSYLNSHMKIHTGEQTHQCEICQRKFAHKASLNYHKATHSGVKPYECNVCSKKFLTNYCLNSHMKIHTGEKPYQCKVCLRKFAHTFGLSHHMTTHSKVKRYECKICGSKFPSNYFLTKHLKSKLHQDSLQKTSQQASSKSPTTTLI